MDVGIHVVNFAWPEGPAAIPTTLGALAESAEEVGARDLSLMDHFFQLEMLGGPEKEMLEGYTALGYLAARTSRVRLGLLVTGVTYRYPALLAKIVTTLDVLSAGRAQLGIGAAWYEREHTGLGVPFPPIAERFERLEETLQICLQMWSENDGAFRGKHYQLEETRNVPQCVQRPRPPILIGGGGEKKTLRLVARYADACNLFTADGVEGVRHKLEVLKRHCEKEGRDYGSIRKTILYMGAPPGGDDAAFFAQMAEYAKVGVEAVMLMPTGHDPVAQVRALEPAVARLAELEPGG